MALKPVVAALITLAVFCIAEVSAERLESGHATQPAPVVLSR